MTPGTGVSRSAPACPRRSRTDPCTRLTPNSREGTPHTISFALAPDHRSPPGLFVRRHRLPLQFDVFFDMHSQTEKVFAPAARWSRKFMPLRPNSSERRKKD